MNRLLSLALVCVLALSLTACGSKDTGAADSDPAAPSQSTPAPEVSVPEVSAPEASQPVPAPFEPVPEVPAPAFALNKSDFTLKTAGASYQLKLSADGMDKANAVWTSSDETVATVAEDGTVTAVAPGTTTVTVSLDGMEANCIVRCSWKEQTETPDRSDSSDPAASVDLNAFVMDLATQYGESFAANANVVEYGMHADLYPGITDIAANQLVIYQPMMGAVVCEIALIEVADSADVAAAKGIFQARIDAQVDGGAWYPASIEGWQNNSRIVSNGNYVMMIAWDLCDEAVAAFNALF